MFWCIRKSEATTKLENGTEALDNLRGCGANGNKKKTFGTYPGDAMKQILKGKHNF